MYQIICDNIIIADTRKENYRILSGKITEKENNCGGFSFQLEQQNEKGGYIIPKRSAISVIQDAREIWRGRMVDVDTDNFGRNTYKCDGLLSYLQDTVIAPFTFTGAPQNLLAQILDEHNAQTDAFKAIAAGTASLSGVSSITYELKKYSTTWAVFQDLIKGHGGRLYFSRGDSSLTLNWSDNSEYRNTQSIKYGKNLISIIKKRAGSDIYTGICPIGKDNLNISSVNSGSKFYFDADAMAIFGKIAYPKDFSSIENAAELKTAGIADLKAYLDATLQLTISAVDLSIEDQAVEAVYIGDYLEVVSTFHGVADWFPVKEISRDIVNSTKSTITLGVTRTFLTRIMASK